MAEAYLIDECITFCTRYLNSVVTKFNKLERNEDDEAPQPDDRFIVFKQSGRPLGAETWGQLTESEMKQIQIYCFAEEHKRELRSRGLRDAVVNRRHIKEFPDWFETKDRSDSFVWDMNDVPPETISRAAATIDCRSQEDEEEPDTAAVYTSDDEDEFEFDDNNNRDDMKF
ncbi:hypothetical protein MKW92_036338 [Papaver armeniacum]|nr:hypothetical protein MKW92_036338 [Papaver armeniacum]